MSEETVNTHHINMFLEGKRIRLREVCIEDVNEIYYRWLNDPEITRYLESRFYPNSIISLRNYVKNNSGNKDNLLLAIILKEENRHIGNIKLGPINWLHRFSDVGLLIGEKDCWGKGYATEAIKLISNHAFDHLNLHKLIAGSYDVNKGSIQAFKKAGFSIEGIRKRHYFCENRYIGHVMLGLINKKMEK